MNDSFCFLLLKNEAVNKRHLSRNFDVARFCWEKCLLNICVYHVKLHLVYLLASCYLLAMLSVREGGTVGGGVNYSDVL